MSSIFMSRVCSVLGFVMSKFCCGKYLLCLVFFRVRFVISSVCLSRVGYGTVNLRFWRWNCYGNPFATFSLTIYYRAKEIFKIVLKAGRVFFNGYHFTAVSKPLFCSIYFKHLNFPNICAKKILKAVLEIPNETLRNWLGIFNGFHCFWRSFAVYVTSWLFELENVDGLAGISNNFFLFLAVPQL